MDPIEMCIKKYGAAIGKAIAESMADSEQDDGDMGGEFAPSSEAGYGIGYFTAKLTEYLEASQPYFDSVTGQVEEIVLALRDNFE